MTPKFLAIAALVVLVLIAAAVSLSGVLKAPISYGSSIRAVCVPSTYFTCSNATLTSSGQLRFTATLSSNSSKHVTFSINSSDNFNGTLYNTKLACLTSGLMNPGQFNQSIIYTPLHLVSNSQSDTLTPGEQLTINITCYGGPGVRNNPDFVLMGYTWSPGAINYTTNRWDSGTEVAVLEEG